MNEKIEVLHNICKELMKELETYYEKINRAGGLTTGDLGAVDKLTHALKSVKTTIAMMDAEAGYSESGGMSYRGGMSYARGRGRSARRDSMGRYSREGGYSGNDEAVDMLQEAMEQVHDHQTRQELQRIISRMEN